MRMRSLVILLFTLCFSPFARAIDLLCLYFEARINDSTLQTAKEVQLAARESLPIARAQFLPVIDFQATHLVNHSTSPPIGSFHTNTLNLTLTQPVIHFEHWRKYAQASDIVKSANATFSAAEQDLMIRLAQAYFGVLQAIDNLYYARSSVKAFSKFLEQTEQRFEVGLIAITDVEIARAQHDNAVALAIAAENEVNNQKEKLRIITGRTVSQINPLREELSLAPPCPLNIEEWVSTALAQNFQLQASRFTALAAKNQIKIDNYAHLPTVDIIGQVERSSLLVTLPGPQITESNVGVQINFPISRGGGFVAKTRQSIHNYLKSDRELETLYRTVESVTRQSFRSVLTQISQVKALQQAVVSNQSALEATHASFNVGTRTIVDVLNAQTDLIRAQQSFAAARYSYILQGLLLKQASGILCEEDIRHVNSWLVQKKTTDLLEAPGVWTDPYMLRSRRNPLTQESADTTTDTSTKKAVLKTGKPVIQTGPPLHTQDTQNTQEVTPDASGKNNASDNNAQDPGNAGNTGKDPILPEQSEIIKMKIEKEVKAMEPFERDHVQPGPPVLKTGAPVIQYEQVNTPKETLEKSLEPTESVESNSKTSKGAQQKTAPAKNIRRPLIETPATVLPRSPVTAPTPGQTTTPITPITPAVPSSTKPAELPGRNLPNTDQFNRPVNTLPAAPSTPSSPSSPSSQSEPVFDLRPKLVSNTDASELKEEDHQR